MIEDLYLDPDGFLGTGASLLADLTLLAYVFLILPAMIVGFAFARRKMFRPHHKYAMTIITLVNWGLILFLMIAAIRYDVGDNIGDEPGNSRYLLPAIHGFLGLAAQLLASFLVIRMLWEDWQIARAKQRGETNSQKYWLKNAKQYMRLTLGLWFFIAALGILTYITRYEVIDPVNLGGDDVDSPAATQEVVPEATEEIVLPADTGQNTPEPGAETSGDQDTPQPETIEAPGDSS